MKRSILFFLILITFSLQLKAQNFEGKITYEVEYNSKIPTATKEVFSKMLGDINEYYIKNNTYKTISNGSMVQYALFVPAENRVYSKLSNSETLLWNDCKENKTPVIKFEILETEKEILGYKCKVLVVETKDGKSSYYFNEEIKVDPKLFQEHAMGNWSFILEKINALPLRMEVTTAQFSMISEATKVETLELKDDFFALPDLPSQKSPF